MAYQHPRQPGWIYFVYAEEVQRTKIGFTFGKIQSRIEALQTGSPCELSLRCAMGGIRQKERALHDDLSHCRHHGEWFDECDELKRLVARLSLCTGYKCFYQQEDVNRCIYGLNGLEDLQERINALSLIEGSCDVIHALKSDLAYYLFEHHHDLRKYSDDAPSGIRNHLYSQIPPCDCQARKRAKCFA